ncbi:hypothetical protein DSM104443_00482 [Usitatibacter rugosus]|uniref:RNA polymerase sigma factor n=1 Tax=Usitatibacter rugosus TaxID=2732067 RepID=A0A6M4GRL8_9PROT|nr:RNA polymerase sigma factor [Usitatibacter rugosus]QJR09438.1 hypothetical protein DSM104443_00482 [Usitatibacter rugosus]
MTASPAARPAPTTDGEFVERICAGDQAAFALLMRKYNRVLFRTARAILRDDAEAEDALQEGYLAAYRAMPSFRGDARLSTWLVRIVANQALARRRKIVRTAEVISLEGPASGEAEGYADSGSSDPGTPERATLRGETRRLIETSIDALPEAFRAVFILRAVEEMSVEEVAASLEIPEATVRSRHFRARGMLREALSRQIDTALEEAFSFAGERCDRVVAGVLARLAALPPLTGEKP